MIIIWLRLAYLKCTMHFWVIFLLVSHPYLKNYHEIAVGSFVKSTFGLVFQKNIYKPLTIIIWLRLLNHKSVLYFIVVFFLLRHPLLKIYKKIAVRGFANSYLGLVFTKMFMNILTSWIGYGCHITNVFYIFYWSFCF